jgi:hypothetical protein
LKLPPKTLMTSTARYTRIQNLPEILKRLELDVTKLTTRRLTQQIRVDDTSLQLHMSRPPIWRTLQNAAPDLDSDHLDRIAEYDRAFLGNLTLWISLEEKGLLAELDLNTVQAVDAALLHLLVGLGDLRLGYVLEGVYFTGEFEEILACGGEWEVPVAEAVVNCD